MLEACNMHNSSRRRGRIMKVCDLFYDRLEPCKRAGITTGLSHKRTVHKEGRNNTWQLRTSASNANDWTTNSGAGNLPPHKLKSPRIGCNPVPSVCRPDNHCQRRFSTAEGQNSCNFGPRLHKLTTPWRDSSNCEFSRGDTSSNVCAAKHFNFSVQFSPWISTCRSSTLDGIAGHTFEGSFRISSVWPIHGKVNEPGRHVLE